MKSLLLAVTFVTLMGSGASASESEYNFNCRLRYREPAIQLLNSIKAFQEGYISNSDLAQTAASASIEVTTLNMYCLAESPQNRSCVQGYKDLYTSIRSRVKILALLSGNQTDVQRSAWNDLKGFVKIEFLDRKCAQ